MFKRVLLSLAVVGMMAAPALAELTVPQVGLTPTQVNGTRAFPTSYLQFGIVTSGGGLTQSYHLAAGASSYVQLTFGFIWPYSQPIQFVYPGYTQTGNFAALGAGYTIFWDQSEVTPVGMGAGPAGQGIRPGATLTPFNYNPLTVASLLTGLVPPVSISQTVGVGLFANRVTPGTWFHTQLSTLVSSVIPLRQVNFMKATFHVIAPSAGSTLDIFISGRVSGRLFNIITTFLGGTSRVDTTRLGTGFIWTTGAGTSGVSITPEPASMALFGAGFVALVGGFWRRKRRLS